MKKLLITLTFTILSSAALAKSMSAFGLNLNNNQKNIESALKTSSAQFDSGYGYKGYVDLPMIKVTDYQGFNKLGKVKTAWLHFDDQKDLYQTTVTFRDSGGLFNRLVPALNQKYGMPNTNSFGFNTVKTYTSGEFEIEIKRNEFGFGENQTTELIYTHIARRKNAEAMKRKIDRIEERKNTQAIQNDI